ncbi:quinoprotein dehydrogenase-associated putative ABC transporter substrate-binding protein [Methylococcus sp. EFPC2]|uniref:quinoprotein dehydrogenase-associated putative ABC transporter substrate-binding protein n=1 Tax=Methylococcus sp. EFPC2 TaxID=2812648 RepID=UPI001967F1A9|nr:quinoprotein dehydrogenase-associated putative ABC transporter substrate-binding protein [Methylococcus sp. EFPC2]QSA98637.1 quinoprotein dehydrogenase-associated putative ABC transporter substrate-binding protein [Methylococcus sp. EFPC2]
MKHRALPLGLGLLALSLAPSAQAWEGKTFKVCADPNNPPYSDKKGQGYENKIAELLAKELGKKVEYTWFPQRMGFIRNTLRSQDPETEEYKCDVIIGMPTGAELVATTQPYYTSTYALVYAKKRGWDDIESADDLDKLPESRKAKLKIAMYDGSPATTWLLNHKLVDYAVPVRSMTADATVNTAQSLEKDIKDGKLDMAIVWGPIAGYLELHNKGGFEVIPVKSEEGVKFEFPISIGVRIPDKARKEELNKLIEKNASAIQKILKDYRVPLVD